MTALVHSPPALPEPLGEYESFKAGLGQALPLHPPPPASPVPIPLKSEEGEAKEQWKEKRKDGREMEGEAAHPGEAEEGRLLGQEVGGG